MANANEIILELKAENKDLSAKLKDTEAKIKHLEGQVKGSTAGLGSALKAGMAGIAAYFTVDFIKNIVDMAGKIDSLRTSFNDMAAGAKGGAEGLMSAMSMAAKETITDEAIMAGANRAILVLGEEVADKLPKLMEIAFSAAKATGKSTEESFDKMVMAIQSGSSKALRQVGLSSAKVSVYVKEYAASLGTTESQLTEVEKKQAMVNAIMRAGEEVIKRTAGEGLTFGQKLQVLKTRMDEMTDQAVSALIPAFDNLLGIWLKFSEMGKGESFLKLSSWAKGLGLVLNELAKNIEIIQLRWQEFTTGLVVTGQAISQLIKTGDFGKFFHDMRIGLTANRMLAEQNMDKLMKKYDQLTKETLAGDRERAKSVKKATEEMGLSEEEYQKRLRNNVTYLEYIGRYREAALQKEKNSLNDVMLLRTTIEKDITAMKQAEIDKRLLSDIDAHNKEKQSAQDLMEAKIGFRNIEFQSMMTVMNQASVLMTSGNKKIFNLGKALAYATALMNAAQAITRVWAVWSAYPPIAIAFSAITALATGVQLLKIKETKLPSHQKGRVPSFAEGYYPSDHYPAMIGAKEAVINERSTIANAGVLKMMNDNPGKSVGGQVINNVVNVQGSIIDKEGFNKAVAEGNLDISKRTGTSIYKREAVY